MKPEDALQCRTMNELLACLECESHCVPTVEFAVRNIELPLDNVDYDFLNQTEINLFAQTAQQNSNQQLRVATSHNLSDMTITFDEPFILLGICLYAYGEPYGMTIEGNAIGPVDVMDTFGSTPASPLNLRGNAALTAALFAGGQAPNGVNLCPAQIVHGYPSWAATWAFMHAWRMQMICPNSSYQILMDESCADLGNCCSSANFNGFSSHRQGMIDIANRLNTRLGSMTQPTIGGVTDNLSYIFPINSEQAADGELSPYRYTADPAAFGASKHPGAIEQWYRLPCPIPFPSIPQPKIKIRLHRDPADTIYHTRMLQELIYQACVSPVEGLTPDTWPLTEGNLPGATTGHDAFTRAPSGSWRIGVGLKGFQVRDNVCNDLLDALAGKTFAEALAANPMLRGAAAMAGPVTGSYCGSGGCIPVGAMGEPSKG